MSTLLADTIRKTGGTAGVDIKINNSSTYVDGSNKSTNTVAALTKGWINLSLAGTTARSDSLNNSSVTDNATGDFTYGHTNNFNYEGYCTYGLGGGHDSTDGNWDYQLGNYDQTTSASRVRAYNSTAAALRDAIGVSILWTGDLA
jgi:hypothetical protein